MYLILDFEDKNCEEVALSQVVKRVRECKLQADAYKLVKDSIGRIKHVLALD